jgi:1-deoxy-D-xylulose-5-phosphate synthase
MSDKLLTSINYPSDLRLLDEALLLHSLLKNYAIYHRRCFKEGHLGASLGAIELTIALHYI